MGIIVLILLALIFGPPIIFASWGFRRRMTKPESSKLFYIIAVVYLLIAGGVCYSMLNP